MCDLFVLFCCCLTKLIINIYFKFRYSLVSTPISNDIVCTRRGDYSTSTKITEVHDNNQNDNHLTVALAFKYGLLLLAALSLPVILFKMFILPMAILTSLKMISLVNSLLLGSLLLKYKWAHAQSLDNNHGGPTGHGNGGNGNNGVNGGGTAGGGTASPSSSLGNRIELGYVDSNSDKLKSFQLHTNTHLIMFCLSACMFQFF